MKKQKKKITVKRKHSSTKKQEPSDSIKDVSEENLSDDNLRLNVFFMDTVSMKRTDIDADKVMLVVNDGKYEFAIDAKPESSKLNLYAYSGNRSKTVFSSLQISLKDIISLCATKLKRSKL